MPKSSTRNKSKANAPTSLFRALRSNDLAFVFSVLLMLLSLITMIGWWTKSPSLVTVMPEWPPMFFNTAICTLLGGGGLFLYSQKESIKNELVVIIIGILMIVFPALILCQEIVGLNFGIDELFSKDWFTKEEHPGRTPINTAISIILFGLFFLLLSIKKNIYTIILIQILSAILFFIGFLGFSGYLLDLKVLYDWGPFKPMSLQTSLSILILTIGLWLVWRKKEWTNQLYKDREDLRIIIITSIILSSFMLFTVLHEFSNIIENRKETIRSILLDKTEDMQSIISKNLNDIDNSIKSMKQDLFTQSATNQPQDFKNLQDLIKFHLYSSNVTAIEWRDKNNKIIYLFNELTEKPKLIIPLQNQKELLWDNQMIYRQTIPINIGINSYGYIVAEWILTAFNSEYFNYKRLGTTGETILCQTNNKEEALCLPSRFNSTFFLIKSKNTPIYYAPQGAHGIMESIDYRGNMVLASYGPLDHLPLGIVVQRSVDEIYISIKTIISKFVLMILIFMFVGIITLYWQIQPLIKRVILSRKQAIIANKNLETVNQKLMNNLKTLTEIQKESDQLAEISTFLEVSNTIEEATNICTKYCLKLFPNSSGALYLMSTDKTMLQCISTWGHPINNLKDLTPNACWAIRKGELLLAFPPHFEVLCEHIRMTQNGSLSFCCQPLKAHGTIIGLLYLELPQISEYNEKDLSTLERFITHFSDTIGILLANIRLREELRLQAILDPLTGLYNRRLLDETFNRYIEIAKRKALSLAILMIDIDKFKDFNDQYGHEAGDIVLQKVSAFLQKNIREYNIACRFGGEEFLIVLLDISPQDVLTRAESIREGIEQIHIIHHDQILPKITVSIGISMYPENGQEVKQLIEIADKALYQAKKEGRNKVVMTTKE